MLEVTAAISASAGGTIAGLIDGFGVIFEFCIDQADLARGSECVGISGISGG